MPIDSSIALGVKPIEVENSMNSLARMMQVQGLQSQNELSRMTMDQTRLDRADLNALREDLKAPGVDVAAALLRHGKPKEAADWTTSQNTNAKAKIELVDAAAKQSRSWLDRVRTPEEFVQWHIGNHADPVLGPALAARGIKAEQSMASIAEAVRTGKFEELLNQSRLGIEKFTELNKPSYQTRDAGGTMETLRLSGLGDAPPVVVSSIKKTQSPDSIASNGIARERLTEDKRHHGVVEQTARDTKEEGKWQYDSERGGMVNLQSGEFKPATQGGAPIGPKVKPDNASEGERKAATLLKRLAFSETQLETALADDKSAATPSLLSNGLRTVGMEAAANKYDSSTRQRVEGAQLDILDAALTLGTGAAYTRDQLEGYRKSYFPQIGDDAKAIDDKKARLANVIQAAKIAAGRAAPKTPETPTKTVKRTGKTADGKKVIEYTDGSVEYAS